MNDSDSQEIDLVKAMETLHNKPIDYLIARGPCVTLDLNLSEDSVMTCKDVMRVFSEEISYEIKTPFYLRRDECSGSKNYIDLSVFGIKFFRIFLENYYDWADVDLVSKLINERLDVIDPLIKFTLSTLQERIKELEKEHTYNAYKTLCSYYYGVNNDAKAFHYLRLLEPYEVDGLIYDLAEAYRTGDGCERNEGMGIYYHKENLKRIITGKGQYKFCKINSIGSERKLDDVDSLYIFAYGQGEYFP